MDTRAYERRLKQLNRWLEQSTDAGMRAKYERAIELTNAAAQSLLDLGSTVESELNDYRRFADGVVELRTARSVALAQRADDVLRHLEQPASDQEKTLAQIQRSSISIAIKTEEIAAFQFAMIDAQHSREMAGVSALMDALVKHILNRTEQSFRKEAALAAIDLTIGAAPGLGILWGLGKGVHKLWNLGESSARDAEKHNAYVNDYCEALARWLAAAEARLARLESASARGWP